MASDAPIEEEKTPPAPFQLFQAPDRQWEAARARLGFLNGLLIGVAVALGIWGTELVALLGVPFAGRFVPVLLGLLTFGLLGAIIGWLTARLNKALVTILSWLALTGLWAYLAGHLPYRAYTWYAWLRAPEFWGTDIFPFAGAAWGALVVAGLLTHIVIIVLALLQEFRLEGLQATLGQNKRPGRRTWLLLLAPLPVVLLMTLATHVTGGEQIWRAPYLVDHAIQVGRDYQGDLFELSRQEGVNYNAVASIRDQIGGRYTLHLGEILPEIATTVVVADFDNGAWIICRILAGNLNYCFDAAPIYFAETAAAIAGEPPADCLNCTFRDSFDWRGWLHRRQDQLGANPTITRELMQGNFVWLRISSSESDYSVRCQFRGLNTIKLDWCQE
ncbi:MAG: hypothetical protein KDE09_01350 [Anaerolineales bacterium]|nr:hypothetical protein [Anaerolineales bacterium]MCB0010384.1 hypothetical protein [Anaerolineales bacterium]MCB0016400.1 hypothetical protein [Anaerolineales bacterium]MCB8961491.1 hypothetical protein [Ardenticatenales bacterium]